MMTAAPLYQHLLVGVDLTEESTIVLQKACALAQAIGASISLAHVIEPLSLAYSGDIPMDLSEVQEQLRQKAQQQLTELASHACAQAIKQQHVLLGQPATELHQLSKELNCDAIIVGSHGRKGLALLLGSTSNSVLHGAQCDVLAIRV